MVSVSFCVSESPSQFACLVELLQETSVKLFLELADLSSLKP